MRGRREGKRGERGRGGEGRGGREGGAEGRGRGEGRRLVEHSEELKLSKN